MNIKPFKFMLDGIISDHIGELRSDAKDITYRVKNANGSVQLVLRRLKEDDSLNELATSAFAGTVVAMACYLESLAIRNALHEVIIRLDDRITAYDTALLRVCGTKSDAASAVAQLTLETNVSVADLMTAAMEVFEFFDSDKSSDPDQEAVGMIVVNPIIPPTPTKSSTSTLSRLLCPQGT